MTRDIALDVDGFAEVIVAAIKTAVRPLHESLTRLEARVAEVEARTQPATDAARVSEKLRRELEIV